MENRLFVTVEIWTHITKFLGYDFHACIVLEVGVDDGNNQKSTQITSIQDDVTESAR